MTSRCFEPEARPLTSHRFSAILPMLPGLKDRTGEELIALLKECIVKAGLTAVAQVEAAFEPYGLSAIVVLQESHVAAHCWPEVNKVLVDVHICDYYSDNLERAKSLCSALAERMSGETSLSVWHYARIDEKPCTTTVLAESPAG